MTNENNLRCPCCGHLMTTDQEAEASAARAKADHAEIFRITEEAIKRLKRVKDEAGKFSRGDGLTNA